MKCERCQSTIEPGDEHEHRGMILCEDCYMDFLSPSRTCDPWAVYSAKSSVEKGGGEVQLTATQTEILRLLEETGGLEPEELAERLRIKPTDLDREFSTLRHMEKVRAELRDGRKVFRLW